MPAFTPDNSACAPGWDPNVKAWTGETRFEPPIDWQARAEKAEARVADLEAAAEDIWPLVNEVRAIVADHYPDGSKHDDPEYVRRRSVTAALVRQALALRDALDSVSAAKEQECMSSSSSSPPPSGPLSSAGSSTGSSTGDVDRPSEATPGRSSQRMWREVAIRFCEASGSEGSIDDCIARVAERCSDKAKVDASDMRRAAVDFFRDHTVLILEGKHVYELTRLLEEARNEGIEIGAASLVSETPQPDALLQSALRAIEAHKPLVVAARQVCLLVRNLDFSDANVPARWVRALRDALQGLPLDELDAVSAETGSDPNG
jgi:hypothetical protein